MKTAVNGTVWGGYAKFTGAAYDWKQFVREAAEAGYEGVEIGGSEKSLGKPAECRAFVESCGLEIAAFSANVTYNPWPPNTESYRQSLRYAAELGVTTIMTCGGFIPNQRRNTYPFDYDMFAGNLGRAMEYAERRGLTIAYHPHRGSVVETIREAAEMVRRLPTLKFCIDIAHLEASGENALAFIERFHRRIIYTHIKDYSWKRDSFIELGKGDGKLDPAACVRRLARHGYDGWLALELDKKYPVKGKVLTPLESARMCRRYLARVAS
jgi:inosose dehydratase